MRTAVALAALLALSACATTGGGVDCGPDSEARGTAELYFGRNIGDRPGVSDADWHAFVDAEVTPRFPDGLTVLDAAGQWRSRDTGTIGREASKVLVIVLPGADDDRARLNAVREAYKTRFRQQAVMLVERRACVAF